MYAFLALRFQMEPREFCLLIIFLKEENETTIYGAAVCAVAQPKCIVELNFNYRSLLSSWVSFTSLQSGI